MSVFSGFRPFLTKGSTINGVQNVFFSDGTTGFHYLPSLTDARNFSNAATFGQRVHSLQDLKLGAQNLGLELVTNGTFDSGTTGWSATGGSTNSVVDGKLNVIAAGASNGSFTVMTGLKIGSTYRILATVNRNGATNVHISVSASGSTEPRVYTYQSASDVGDVNIESYFVATATSHRIHVGRDCIGTSIYDNISVREVLNAAYALQASNSLTPLLGRAPRIRTNLINNSEDLTTWTLANVTTTANKVMENTTVEMHVARAVAPEIYFNTDYYFTVEVKAAEKNYAVVGAWWTGGVAAGGVIINLTNGTYAGDWFRSPGNISATFLGSENVGDGWWRIRVYINNLTNASPAHPIVGLTNSTTTVVNEVYAGTVGHGVFVRKAHASLTPFTVYQKTESNRLITTDETQTSFPFIRLDLSDDVLNTNNLVSQRNLLRYTEEFDNTYWAKQVSATVVQNSIIAPDNSTTSSTFIPTAQYSNVNRLESRPLGTYTFSVYMKVDSGTRNIHIGCSPDGLYLKVAPQTVTNTWQRFTYTFTHDNSSFNIGGLIQDRNASGFVNVHIWGAQLEVGSVATEYEYGGIKGTVVAAGKNGTAVETVYAPNGNFSVGPTSYTGGTPGILRAVGDIVGYSLIGRSTTEVERDQLIEFYKFRGAKGRLVEGPELFNFGSDWMGDFTISAANSLFYTSGPTAAISFDNTAGTLTVTQDAGYYYGYAGILLNNERKLSVGKSYKVTVRILSVTVAGWGVVAVNGSYLDANTLGFIPLTVTSQPQTRSFTFISGGGSHEQLRLSVGGPAGTAIYDYVSIKEIRPEEEW